MREAHKEANQGKFPTSDQFDLVAGHLVATLNELGVGEKEIEDIVAIAMSVKNDVTGKGQRKQEHVKALFDRIGGTAAVDAAVEMFYGKIMADDRLQPLFQATNMAKLKQHQKLFLTQAFGGPKKYSGLDMMTAHGKVNGGTFPSAEQFDMVAGHLVQTLSDLKVPEQEIQEIVAIAMSVKDQVLGLAAPAEEHHHHHHHH